MDSATSSLISTLVENAKYMPDDADDTKTKEPSACELQCQVQQASLVACMQSIRQQNETSSSIGSSSDNTNNQCLAPSIADWTDCCSKANNGQN
jgi:hypothetical protein